MKIVIIDYGSGNLHSTVKAFELKASEVGGEVTLSNKISDIDTASHIVLPGVGAFKDCMDGLSAIDGMIDVLKKNVLEDKKPFLGICVGMQLLAEKAYEHGEHEGLGWIKATVNKVNAGDLKIPHMGWNDLNINGDNLLFAGVNTGDHVYFVHSYHMVCENEKDITATVNYGSDITASIARNNIMGVQFHPEKSQEIGLKIIENFLEIK